MDGDDKLTVRSSDLFQAAGQVREARDAIHNAASAAYGQFRSETKGWIGDSKRALEKAVAELEAHSKSMTNELEERAGRIDYAGREYAATERRNAERLRASGRSSGPGLNMDH
ncbi:WXG100 family type VII secretion target [Williamsia deligens]|uniref:WXG100 family type VII secretion target n=1 Tax=Williamsia deligens TaxID=321325 RepID=A0ABW3G719_9NOCA|nr:WXG100 family type VII secretion target [Williamsia deligens]MCP2192712.1 WXG100 family type VII secretion target [Williamsia deligens]